MVGADGSQSERSALLIVENDPRLAETLRSEAVSLGFTPFIAGTTAEARALLERISFVAGVFEAELSDGSGLDLLQEIGDPDLAWPAHLDRGFDRRADVISVDVAVPQTVAAHDHELVERRGAARRQQQRYCNEPRLHRRAS